MPFDILRFLVGYSAVQSFFAWAKVLGFCHSNIVILDFRSGQRPLKSLRLY